MTISQIKYLRSLHNKKYRQKEKKIILEGKKLINQVLNSNTKIECVWLSHAFIESTSGQELKLKLSKKNINWEVASEKSIARVCESKNNQGLVAISPLPEFNKINPFPNQAIYLDGISDPGNMGTILRSAICCLSVCLGSEFRSISFGTKKYVINNRSKVIAAKR